MGLLKLVTIVYNYDLYFIFSNLCSKLIAYFSTSIPTKKSLTKLFTITQEERKSTRAYLKRFNKVTKKIYIITQFWVPPKLSFFIQK